MWKIIQDLLPYVVIVLAVIWLVKSILEPSKTTNPKPSITSMNELDDFVSEAASKMKEAKASVDETEKQLKQTKDKLN